MNKVFDERLKALADRAAVDVLAGGRKGIEKESLRVTAEGRLSQQPHPLTLGSALTNSYITTDFSEALLEFVTPAFPQTWEALRFLCDIHQFAYANLGDELLWVSSMPCLIMPDGDIPLARYGDSNVGRMKTAYRRGLGHRYGRAMQTIAGLHFNYSVPEPFWEVYQDLQRSKHHADAFRSAGYLGLIRNFRRFGWLVLYLFGASPAVCKSFALGGDSGLQEFDKDSLYEPFATSLRMSDLGYSNKTQASINISLNDLDEYITGLSAAIDTKEPDYEKFGLLVDGEYQQLSMNKLQIENEYYSSIRPKRVAHSGERPTSALRRGGIEYVEVRSLDLGIVDPVGINQNTMRFMEAFLIYCLLCDSPQLTDTDWQELAVNHASVAKQGRDPALKLRRGEADVAMRDWARDILHGVQAVAEFIDRGSDHDDYRQAVDAQLALVEDAEATPSARVLQELREQKIGFFRYALQCAQNHKDYFAALAPLSDARRKMFEQEVATRSGGSAKSKRRTRLISRTICERITPPDCSEWQRLAGLVRVFSVEFLQTTRHASGPSTADNTSIRFQHRRQLAHRARRKHLVRRVKLGQGNIFLPGVDVFLCSDLENHFPRQAGQTGVSERRQQLITLNDKQVRIVGFRDEAIHVQHDGAVDLRDIRFNDGQDIVQQVVVMNL